MAEDVRIPLGYQALFYAIEEAGKALEPEFWTGYERSVSKTIIINNTQPPVLRAKLQKLRHRSNMEVNFTNNVARELVAIIADRALFGDLNTSSMENRIDVIERKTLIDSFIQNNIAILFEPTDADFHAVIDRKNDIAVELSEVKRMIKMRKRVESECLMALWSSGEDAPPKCKAYFIDENGSLEDFPSSVWFSEDGKLAAEASEDGHFFSIDGFQRLPLLKNGELAAAVMAMSFDTKPPVIEQPQGEGTTVLNATDSNKGRKQTQNDTCITILNKLYPDGDTGTLTNRQVMDAVNETLPGDEQLKDPSMEKAIPKWRKSFKP